MRGFTAGGTSDWVAPTKGNPNGRLRLFCFPYAGGGDAIFRAWASMLPPTIEVCPVQLPGRGARAKEPPFTQLSPLIDAAADALAPVLDKPFALFGHSVGAIIGFELSQLLRRKYRLGPVHLFVSARPSPQTVRPRASRIPTDREFLELLWNYNGTPEQALANPELMELMLPVIRADFALSQSYGYAHEPPLDCPITAFGGLRDTSISREELKGWGEHTNGRFTLRMLPGDHFFLNADRPLLLDAIARDLYQYA